MLLKNSEPLEKLWGKKIIYKTQILLIDTLDTYAEDKKLHQNY
jgi:hypothetical protein